MRAFFLTIFLSLYFSVSAQVDDFQQDIINYLNVNGTVQQYGVAYEELIDVLKERVAIPDTPESFWYKLKEGKEESIDELIFILTFAYRKHFTQDEIGEILEFYETEAAQKSTSKSLKLTEEEDKIIEDFYKSDVAIKIESIQDELSKDITLIYNDWSREFFAEKLGAIVKAGYSKKM